MTRDSADSYRLDENIDLHTLFICRKVEYIGMQRSDNTIEMLHSCINFYRCLFCLIPSRQLLLRLIKQKLFLNVLIMQQYVMMHHFITDDTCRCKNGNIHNVILHQNTQIHFDDYGHIPSTTLTRCLRSKRR